MYCSVSTVFPSQAILHLKLQHNSFPRCCRFQISINFLLSSLPRNRRLRSRIFRSNFVGNEIILAVMPAPMMTLDPLPLLTQTASKLHYSNARHFLFLRTRHHWKYIIRRESSRVTLYWSCWWNIISFAPHARLRHREVTWELLNAQKFKVVKVLQYETKSVHIPRRKRSKRES